MAIKPKNTNDIQADTIAEITAGAGVTIDGVKLKDSEPYCDVINEKTGAAGVTVDGVLCKDGEVTTDTIHEESAGVGVTIDGVKCKDDTVYFSTAFTWPVADSVDTSVAGAGSDQSGATALTKTLSVISTGSADSGVRLPAAAVGSWAIVLNQVGNNIKVYPATGEEIDDLGTNVAKGLGNWGKLWVTGVSSGSWRTIVFG